MWIHFINDKPVAIGETNLFDPSTERFKSFKKQVENKGFEWINDFTFETRSQSFSFTVTKTKLFTSHENFDVRFYDLINWLNGEDHGRNILKNFN